MNRISEYTSILEQIEQHRRALADLKSSVSLIHAIRDEDGILALLDFKNNSVSLRSRALSFDALRTISLAVLDGQGVKTGSVLRAEASDAKEAPPVKEHAGLAEVAMKASEHHVPISDLILAREWAAQHIHSGCIVRIRDSTYDDSINVAVPWLTRQRVSRLSQNRKITKVTVWFPTTPTIVASAQFGGKKKEAPTASAKDTTADTHREWISDRSAAREWAVEWIKPGRRLRFDRSGDASQQYTITVGSGKAERRKVIDLVSNKKMTGVTVLSSSYPSDVLASAVFGSRANA